MNQHAPVPPYIGQATSRVDGRAKVTGSAKYAGDHNAKGLAHGAVVASTIARPSEARTPWSSVER